MQEIKQKNVHRKSRIESVLHRVITKVLREGKVYNKGVVVSKVSLSNDLKIANVFIILSSWNQEDRNSVLTEINESSYLIQRLIFNDVSLRYVPKLYFKIDTSFDNFTKVNELLENNTQK